MPIALLGANGQLGREFLQTVQADLVPLSRAQGDLTRPLELRRALEAIRPSVVLNCAAYTLVDQAETEPHAAFAVNAWGVRDLALICRDLDCTLVHISTNYVFGLDENRRTPYVETDLPGPTSTYGNSKLAGEYFVQTHCPKHFILRTCGLYGPTDPQSKRSNFVETILRKAATGQPLRLVNDQVCTPTSTYDLVQAVAECLRSEQYGLYHVTNSGACTWYEFARAILELTRQNTPISPIGTPDYPVPAKRPIYSVLEHQQWIEHGFAPLRPWAEALSGYLRRRDKYLAAA